MQNDMLKNNIAPWQDKGQWYHLKVESDGSAWSILYDESDERFQNSVVASGYYIRIIDDKLKNYEESIIDIKVKINAPMTAATLYSTNYNIYLTTTIQHVVLNAANNITGTVDIWLFIG